MTSLSLTQLVSAKTIEALSDAVRAENYRIHAYEVQQRYVAPFLYELESQETTRGEQPLTVLASKSRDYFEQNTEGLRWADIATKVRQDHFFCVKVLISVKHRFLGLRAHSLETSAGPNGLEVCILPSTERHGQTKRSQVLRHSRKKRLTAKLAGRWLPKTSGYVQRLLMF